MAPRSLPLSPDSWHNAQQQEGISLALLPRGYPGLETGPRHDVLSVAFMNGTVKGSDVFIPMDMLIGGQERAGSGWRMLMECLAEGRGISLPALSTGTLGPQLWGLNAYWIP
jgi:alkylation response protein AidB-like acyl-CoA dehydrogenase